MVKNDNNNWLTSLYQKHLSNPEAIILIVMIILGVIVIDTMGKMIAPLIAGLVIAFLLEEMIYPLVKYCKSPRWLAMTVVYIIFLGVLLAVVFWLLPLLIQQLTQVVSELPKMMKNLEALLEKLPQQYPAYISSDHIQNFLSGNAFDIDKVTSVGKVLLAYLGSSVSSIVAWLVYLFLVPLLALFFLKDKTELMTWLSRNLPQKKGLLISVGHEMQGQLGNYVKGKVLELIIVGVVSYIGFIIFGLNYAILLAFLVGLSVIIPYVGMIVVTIPIVIVGLLQWGFEAQFFYMITVYFIIQALDGNVLVPILFGGAVNIHPVAIIAAVLIFGGIWGFWGLFFAIPLATLVNAVLRAWHKYNASV